MYSDAVIGARIKTIFDDEHGLYGAKRIAASLKEAVDFLRGPQMLEVGNAESLARSFMVKHRMAFRKGMYRG